MIFWLGVWVVPESKKNMMMISDYVMAYLASISKIQNIKSRVKIFVW